MQNSSFSSVYVVIVTYNGMKWLSKCLESTNPYSVIVIDNCSTDGTKEFIKSNYPEVVLLEQEENLGFGRANNIGISEALSLGADAVFLMNQDVFLDDNVIINLYSTLKENPDYGIISPIHLNGKGNNLDKDFAYYCLANRKIYFDLFTKNAKRTEYLLPFVNAAAWLISRKCLETVGGFDPEFFHYGEDENYCQRVKFHGFKTVVQTGSFIRHDSLDLKSEAHLQFSTRDLLNFKKFLLLKYGNLNKGFHEKDYIEEFHKIYKNIFKSLLKFNFSQAKGNFKKIEILKEVQRGIKRIRTQNAKKGKNYLR